MVLRLMWHNIMVAVVIALYCAIFTNIYLFLLIFPRACSLILQFHAPRTSLNNQHAHILYGIGWHQWDIFTGIFHVFSGLYLA